MAAEEKIETTYDVSPNLGTKVRKFKFVGETTGDWIIFPEPVGMIKANQLTGVDSVTTYATGAVHTPGITATSTTMVCDGVTEEQMPASGYIRVANGEIIKYSGYDKTLTGDTITLDARGCFGTTAALASDGDVFYILNTIVFTLATPGFEAVRGIYDVIEE